MKKILIIINVTLLIFLLACSEKNKKTEDVNTGETTVRIFTEEELVQYDGKDGRKAYIAVNGDVYDVTDIKQWSDGEHNGFNAGKDVTDALDDKAPHGIGQLKGAKIVGRME